MISALMGSMVHLIGGDMGEMAPPDVIHVREGAITVASSWGHQSGLNRGGSLGVESWHMKKPFGPAKLG